MTSPQVKPFQKKEPVTLAPLKTPSAPVKHGPFELRPDGVYRYKKTKQGTIELHVCSPLKVVAQSRDENSREWGYVLQWKDPDGHVHNWSVPKSLLVKNGTELVEELARGGLNIAPKAKEQVKEYISAVNPSAKILNVSRPGWYTPKGAQRVFVMPSGVVGVLKDHDVVLQQDTYDPSAQKVSGSLDNWKTDVARLCGGNDYFQTVSQR